MKKVHKPYNKLKVWLKDNGITYADVALLLGRTETCVMHKINGYSDFSLSEVTLMKAEYKIKDDIFFTNDVA